MSEKQLDWILGLVEQKALPRKKRTLSGAERSRSYHNRLLSEGRCARCGGPNPTVSPSCASCKQEMKLATIRTTVERRAQGLCISCGEKPASPHLKSGKCEGCVAARSSAQKERRRLKRESQEDASNVQAFYEEQARRRAQGRQEE